MTWLAKFSVLLSCMCPANLVNSAIVVHRRTKKWEAHIWDNRQQMYLGGYMTEQGAARAHDIMALKCRGVESTTNYDKNEYAGLANELDKWSKASRSQWHCKHTLS